MRVTSDDVFVTVGSLQSVPHGSLIFIFVRVHGIGSTRQSLNSNHAQATLSVSVVSMILGEGLLKNGWPHGLVGGDLGEQGCE